MVASNPGSRSFPILIDDSDEEVIYQLTEGEFDTTPPARSPDTSSNASYRGKRITGDQSMTDVARSYHSSIAPPQGSGGLKRKRTGSTAGVFQASVPGPSNTTYPLAPIAGESKKARKRRRKLERQAQQDGEALQAWSNGVPYHMKTGLAKFQPPPLPKEATDTDKRNYAIPQYTVLPYTDTHPYDMQAVESPAASTSAWVSSMAMAADKPRTPWYPPRPHLMFPPAIDTASISYPMPHSSTPTAHSKKSQPPQIIGMKPDPDPYSKHGTFHISSATTQSRPSGDSQKDAYIPNPARTLVMEKLPKQHRTADFAKSWSKSACGAYPVYFAVDYPSGKALVEFATAELARKAWGSPKLGNAFAGLKPHQLKGKPREDLIRVWWYRVDGIGAEAGVGEIEEGEIEGDAGETEVSVPAKKETKKERKARLAQERLAKMKTKDPQTVQKGGKTTQQQQQPSKIDSQPQNGFHNVSKQIEPVAHKPPPFDYIYYPPYPVHPPFPPSTLPQAELAKPKQRRERFAQYKQPDRSYYGSSINEEGSGTHNDHESIASSRAHSIVSERPSPTHDPHNGNEITPMSISDNGDSDNMEIEMDDMEVESPDSYTTMFNLPTAVVDSAHDPSSAPLPSRPTLPVNSPVPKIGQPPPAISTRGVLDAHLIQPLSVPPTLPTPTPTPPSSFVPAAASHNSSTQATTPSTSSSPAPYQAPSEPRAMKNAPKGPSYAKRSLMARQKELEEMIAKSKFQLGQATASKVLTSVQAPVPVALAAATPEPSDTQSTDAAEKLAMEARLRQLVLKSQKNRVKGPTTPAAPPIPPATPLGTDSSPAAIPISTMFSVPGSPARSPVLNSPEATPSLPVTVSNISFDDMAISFITETIQTLQPGSPTPVIPAPPTQAPISKYHTSQTHTQTKLDLAAKQKRLEQHITDSKILMAKLSQARTKQEKDAILAAMRECSRLMEEESHRPSTPATTPDTNASASTAPVGGQHPTPPNIYFELPPGGLGKTSRWPSSLRDAGVLIVSDDEEDSDVGEDEAEV